MSLQPQQQEQRGHGHQSGEGPGAQAAGARGAVLALPALLVGHPHEQPLHHAAGVGAWQHAEFWFRLFDDAREALQEQQRQRERDAEAADERQTTLRVQTLGELRSAAQDQFGLTIAQNATVEATVQLLADHAARDPAIAAWHRELVTQWATYCAALRRQIPVDTMLARERLHGARAFAEITRHITFTHALSSAWPHDAPNFLQEATARIPAADRRATPLISDPFASAPAAPRKRRRAPEALVVPSLRECARLAWAHGVDLATNAWFSEVLRPRHQRLLRCVEALREGVAELPAGLDAEPVGTFAAPTEPLDHLRRLADLFCAHVAELLPRHRSWDPLAAELARLHAAARTELERDQSAADAFVASREAADRLQTTGFVTQVSTLAARVLDDVARDLGAPPLRGETTALNAIRATAQLFREERELVQEPARLPDPPMDPRTAEVVASLVGLPPDAHAATRAVRTWRARLHLAATQVDYTRLRVDRLERFLRSGASLAPARWAETWRALCAVEAGDGPTQQLARRTEADLLAAPTATTFRACALGAIERAASALRSGLPEPVLRAGAEGAPDCPGDLGTAFAAAPPAAQQVALHCAAFTHRSPSLAAWVRDLRRSGTPSLKFYCTLLRHVSAALRLAEACATLPDAADGGPPALEAPRRAQ